MSLAWGLSQAVIYVERRIMSLNILYRENRFNEKAPRKNHILLSFFSLTISYLDCSYILFIASQQAHVFRYVVRTSYHVSNTYLYV